MKIICWITTQTKEMRTMDLPRDGSSFKDIAYQRANDFFAAFHFVNKMPGFDAEPTRENQGADIESVEFPTVDGSSDIDTVDQQYISEQLMLDEEHSMLDTIAIWWTDLVAPLNSNKLNDFTKLCLCLLVFPLSLLAALKQLEMYVIIATFNYTGVNLRSYIWWEIATERDNMILEEKFKHQPLTLNKIIWVSERYLAYWLAVILLVSASPFINKLNLFDIIDAYTFIESNSTLNYVVQVGISAFVAFANIIPSRAIRPDIGSFLSSFTEDDYTIRDSAHTRLKDLSEVLDDIKKIGFALLQTDISTPIIVSTKVPEELRLLPGFTALLATTTFDNNQILRFIQIEEDVDTFFVLRNDIGMCHYIEYDPVNKDNIVSVMLQHKLHVDISVYDLQCYSGASFVLMVALFATSTRVNIAAILLAWILWPLAMALIYRRRKSKLASVNFFTLDGKDRKYQPFNNICVSTDDLILTKIHNFRFFQALARFTMQPRYLIHTLLKVTEDIEYDWLNHGLKLKDFKRLANLAVTTYEKDVGIVTPNARMYYYAPRKRNDSCLVCLISAKGEVTSEIMTREHFTKLTKNLPDCDDSARFENMLLK